MLLHLQLKDDGTIPGLPQAIARQKAEGGYLIQYPRLWSVLVVSRTQYRVAHVHFGQSRVLPGLKHSLFTLVLGIWSPLGLLVTPMFLLLNLRGGMDVTAKFSTVSIDPMRHLPPVPGQGDRDLRKAQWIYLGIVIVLVAAIVWWAVGP